MSFIEELKRRNVFRAILAYAVAGWLLVEGMDLLTDAFEAPAWVLQVFIGAVFLGILPVAVFSWAYDITPDGIRKDSAAASGQASTTGRKLDIIVIAMLAVAIGLVIEQRLRGGDTASQSSPGERAAIQDAPPMLAVLPFVSTSLEGEGEFFASGIHDDVLTQLAQLQSIRVISRTSVLEYRDTVKNIREIAAELGADAILEGGIQHAGDRIRINVQLIDAKSDEHLWAQSYDRKLSTANIFDVQTEIASAVTSALRITLTTQDGAQAAQLPTDNMAAYRAYHRAMAIRDAPLEYDTKGFQRALEEAVQLDPGFTRAWAELAGSLSFQSFSSPGEPALVQRSEQILETIREQAPGSAEHLIAQTYYSYYIMKDYERAHRLITQAQEMAPSDARLVELKSWIERRLGDLDAMADSIRLVRTLDPRNPRWTRSLLTTLMLAHRYEVASEEIEASSLQDYQISYYQSLLALRRHRDIDRWAESVVALATEFDTTHDPQYLWGAYIAARDYPSAERVSRAAQGPGRHDAESRAGSSMRKLTPLLSAWFTQQEDLTEQLLVRARERLELEQQPDSGVRGDRLLIDQAVLAAISGDAPEAERLIRRWARATRADQAEWIGSRHHACRILGIAGATAAAVQCLRSGLAEPSMVMPFLEAFLPYYDSMRTSPEFVRLLEDLDTPAYQP